MKVRVLKPFKDKYTGEYYKVGRVLEDITKERFEEILTVDELVEEIKEEASEAPKKKTTRKKTAKKTTEKDC